METKVKQQKERLCEIVGKKMTPEGDWIEVSLFTGTIFECEWYWDSREWIGFKNMKVITKEKTNNEQESN
tara:strand:- start:802 stop:1011 length:210 start_codon:yes stop_codon:yes gene_type:complete